MMAKYLTTSLATENVVSAPRVISICLPVSTISMSFVGFESRSTMLPASFAAWVPVFIATATSAWASAGASLVPSPVIATSLPAACCWRISFSFASGVASGRKSSTPASAAMAAAVRRLSPVIITVLMPIRRSSANRSLMPPLTMSFSSITPSTRPRPAASATTSGVEPRRATVSTSVWTSGGKTPPRSVTHFRTASPAPLRIFRSGRSTPLMRVCAENFTNVALAKPELLLGEDHDAPSLRRLVGKRRELGGIGQVALVHAGSRQKLGRLAVAERDRPGLVEQQDVDVSRRFDRSPRHRDDVLRDQAADPGDADR